MKSKTGWQIKENAWESFVQDLAKFGKISYDSQNNYCVMKALDFFHNYNPKLIFYIYTRTLGQKIYMRISHKKGQTKSATFQENESCLQTKNKITKSFKRGAIPNLTLQPISTSSSNPIVFLGFSASQSIHLWRENPPRTSKSKQFIVGNLLNLFWHSYDILIFFLSLLRTQEIV